MVARGIRKCAGSENSLRITEANASSFIPCPCRHRMSGAAASLVPDSSRNSIAPFLGAESASYRPKTKAAHPKVSRSVTPACDPTRRSGYVLYAAPVRLGIRGSHSLARLDRLQGAQDVVGLAELVGGGAVVDRTLVDEGAVRRDHEHVRRGERSVRLSDRAGLIEE